MNKIIQWNIRETRVSYSELLLLITKYCLANICLLETTPSSTLKIIIRVIPLLLGDINNSYPRIFSRAISSPTLREKSEILLFCFFISLNRSWERRRDTQRNYILLFLSAHAKISGTCGPPAITTSSKHVRRQLSFSQKATSIYLENPELNFPPIEETYIFYLPENLKFIGTKKKIPVWSLWVMNSKPDLVAIMAFHPVIWHLKRMKNILSPLFFTLLG